MREALQGLTTRGRGFLAAGVTAAVCALLLGQTDLFRIGILLALLPLFCAYVVLRTRFRLSLTRRLQPARIPAGSDATAVLRLENVSRLPTGLLLLEDRIPFVLGPRPRFVLDRVESHGGREVRYGLRSEARGIFEIGPLTLRLTDPFGMCEVVRSYTATDHLVVTPVVQQLPVVPLGGQWAGSGESRARSLAAAGEDDVAPREYRQGDDMRRVHWRTTARVGELMVRREEQPWESRATILLDTRSAAHQGEGPTSSFEWAVSAAASIGVHLSRAGYTIELITEDGLDIVGVGNDVVKAGSDLLLDSLAVLEPSNRPTLLGASQALRHHIGDGLLVAILGSMSPSEATSLARLRHGATAALGILLETGTWPGREPHTEGEHSLTTAVLRGAGWRAVTARYGDRLPDLWPWVARGHVATGSVASTVASDLAAGSAAS
jgi:uncharacterized protein (DUF58 family)